jgi:hypothetical protein
MHRFLLLFEAGEENNYKYAEEFRVERTKFNVQRVWYVSYVLRNNSH